MQCGTLLDTPGRDPVEAEIVEIPFRPSVNPSAREVAKAAGRDPGAIGIEGRISFGDGDPDTWSKAAAAWDEVGATPLSVNTMRAGLKGPDEHIDAIRRFKEAVSD